MNFQTRVELQTMVQGYIDSIMRQYGVSAAAMEDALNATLLKLKDQVMGDLIAEAREAAMAAAAAQEPNQEEDNDGEQNI